MTELNYQNELKSIAEEQTSQKKEKSDKEWLSLPVGSNKIKITKVGGTFPDKKFGGEKRLFEVEFNGIGYLWSVSIKKSLMSIYGQLMVLGTVWGNLEGKEITVMVKQASGRKDYTIVEAMEYVAKYQGDK